MKKTIQTVALAIIALASNGSAESTTRAESSKHLHGRCIATEFGLQIGQSFAFERTHN